MLSAEQLTLPLGVLQLVAVRGGIEVYRDGRFVGFVWRDRAGWFPSRWPYADGRYPTPEAAAEAVPC